MSKKIFCVSGSVSVESYNLDDTYIEVDDFVDDFDDGCDDLRNFEFFVRAESIESAREVVEIYYSNISDSFDEVYTIIHIDVVLATKDELSVIDNKDIMEA